MLPTLILTRPIAQSEAFAAAVSEAWGRPLNIVLSPLMQIVMLEMSLPATDAVIFTSANGVAAARHLGLKNGMKAWCVGEKTAQAARDTGFAPVTGPGDADGLVAMIIASGTQDRLLHLRGQHATGDVSDRLVSAGVKCADAIAYDQISCALTQDAQAVLSGTAPVLAPLFSPRSAQLLQSQGPFAAPLHVIAISASVKDALDANTPWPITIAPNPDAPAMLQATLAALSHIHPCPPIA